MALQKIPGRAIQLDSQVSSDVMYFDGTDWVRLAKGEAGEVLTVNITGTAIICELAKDHNAKLIYSSSSSINNGEHSNDAATSAFNKIPEEQIEEKFIDALRGLAEEINELSSSEDLDLHIGDKLQGGLQLPTDDTPKDFIRKLLFSK